MSEHAWEAHAWKDLVQRYADGRHVCNCGDAYYTPCGVGLLNDGTAVTDALVCRYGCSANQLDAKKDIARRVLEDFERYNVPAPPEQPTRPGRHALIVASQLPYR